MSLEILQGHFVLAKDDEFRLVWRMENGGRFLFNKKRGFNFCHQTFQVPNIEVLTYISCMDTAYVREHPPQE